MPTVIHVLGVSGISEKKKQWHIYFGYFRHSAAHLFLHMLRKFRIFSLPGHVLQLAYLFRIFRTLAAHLFVHMLQKFRIFSGHLPKHQGCFSFKYSGHSQDMYYSLHIYFRYFGHSAAHLFVHMLQKFRISSQHYPK